MDACFMGDAALRVDLPSKESDVMTCPEGDDREPLAGEMAMTQFRGNCGIPKAINLSLFQNPEIDALMSHYNVHVAGLVIPVDHSENPYRRLYLSTAIEGILKRETSAKSPIEMAYNSLYQSLLASAAYHRWYCDQRQTRYREIGAKYRYHAMQSLQDAVQQGAPEANYQVLTMTMLSFVTIGVKFPLSCDSSARTLTDDRFYPATVMTFAFISTQLLSYADPEVNGSSSAAQRNNSMK